MGGPPLVGPLKKARSNTIFFTTAFFVARGRAPPSLCLIGGWVACTVWRCVCFSRHVPLNVPSNSCSTRPKPGVCGKHSCRKNSIISQMDQSYRWYMQFRVSICPALRGRTCTDHFPCLRFAVEGTQLAILK